MTRVKRGITKSKHRKNILKQTKGYRFGRSTKKREAKEAIAHAGAHAFAHRRKKKNDFRRLWNVHINAAVRSTGGISYSVFIGLLKKKGIALDRKILSTIAKENPETFERIVKEVS